MPEYQECQVPAPLRAVQTLAHRLLSARLGAVHTTHHTTCHAALAQGRSTGTSHSLPPVWLQNFHSQEFPVQEFPGDFLDSGISQVLGIARLVGVF